MADPRIQFGKVGLECCLALRFRPNERVETFGVEDSVQPGVELVDGGGCYPRAGPARQGAEAVCEQPFEGVGLTLGFALGSALGYAVGFTLSID